MGVAFGPGLRPCGAEPQASQAKPLVPIAGDLGFTGTQWPLTTAQKNTLADAMLGFREGGAVWMNNGDCINADAFAGQYWRAIGGKLRLHPPEIAAKRAWLVCDEERPLRPYLVRNVNIVTASDAMLAAPREMTEQRRGGTWSTIRMARRKGMPLMIVLPDGSFTKEHWPAQGMSAGTAETAQQAQGEARQPGPKDAPITPSHPDPHKSKEGVA